MRKDGESEKNGENMEERGVEGERIEERTVERERAYGRRGVAGEKGRRLGKREVEREMVKKKERK